MFDYLMGTSLLEAVEGGFGEMTAEDDAYMESIESIPCYDDPDDAFMRAAMESVENFYAIANAITVDEFAQYIATNEEVIYEEGKITKIFDNIKEWIKKGWAKIKGIFEKAINMIESKIRDDKKFLDKYKSKIAGKEVTLKNGYSISWSDASNTDYIKKLQNSFNVKTSMITTTLSLASNSGTYEKFVTGVNDLKEEDIMKNIRGRVFGSDNDNLTQEEFNARLKEKLNPEKTSGVNIKAADAINEVENAKSSKAAIKSQYNSTKQFFDTLMKQADTVKKNAITIVGKSDAKEAGVMKAVGKWNSMCKSCITLAHQIEKAQLSAINKLRSQSRAAIVKMAQEEKKDNGSSKNESASFLDSVVLI